MMKYYPIGTVVTLVNGNRPLMIWTQANPE